MKKDFERGPFFLRLSGLSCAFLRFLPKVLIIVKVLQKCSINSDLSR